MNLRDLKYLIAVSEHLNFGKAAEACNVSQPTLSMQIKKLEEYLRLSIFERSNKSVMLTDYGHEIVKMARGIIAGADDLVAYSKSCRDPLAGDFRLGAFPTVAPYFLPKIIAPIKALPIGIASFQRLAGWS
jgi:LysR family hydrogen peroxide-inducible transcriptional activator